MAAPVGVLNGNHRHNRLTTDEMLDATEPRPYDKKLAVIKNSLGGAFDEWYQNIVNLPAPKWRAAIDNQISALCDADKNQNRR